MSTGKDKTAGELMQRLRELMLIRDTTRTTGGKGRSPGNHAALPAREPRWLPTRRPTTNRPQPRPPQYRVRFRRSPGHCVKGLLDHCLLKPKFIFIYLLSKHTVSIDQSVWPFPVGGARDTACSFPRGKVRCITVSLLDFRAGCTRLKERRYSHLRYPRTSSQNYRTTDRDQGDRGNQLPRTTIMAKRNERHALGRLRHMLVSGVHRVFRRPTTAEDVVDGSEAK